MNECPHPASDTRAIPGGFYCRACKEICFSIHWFPPKDSGLWCTCGWGMYVLCSDSGPSSIEDCPIHKAQPKEAAWKK